MRGWRSCWRRTLRSTTYVGVRCLSRSRQHCGSIRGEQDERSRNVAKMGPQCYRSRCGYRRWCCFESGRRRDTPSCGCVSTLGQENVRWVVRIGYGISACLQRARLLCDRAARARSADGSRHGGRSDWVGAMYRRSGVDVEYGYRAALVLGVTGGYGASLCVDRRQVVAIIAADELKLFPRPQRDHGIEPAEGERVRQRDCWPGCARLVDDDVDVE